MQGSISAHTSSHCGHDSGFVPGDNGLGELFRQYGEQYINSYALGKIQIKLIGSIRVCRTPALGGKAYVCKNCNERRYVYFGCGNSRCPKCQGIKRMQWQDKLASRLLSSPYQHIVFTLPHRLNSLARRNPKQIYNCLMRSAWQSLKITCADSNNLGALPGAVMVLHTFGSDLKYHVHVHALVTFGGIDKAGYWQWPKRKRKIVAFRQIRSVFRNHFLHRLNSIYDQLDVTESYVDLYDELRQKSWCVHQEPPTANARTISEYLGKYINRIGLSISRFEYDQVHDTVTLIHKDYNKQQNSKDKPPLIPKTMHPLVAIHQILQHCLPAYFQKCRYYGLHSNASYKKHKEKLPNLVKDNGQTIRTVIQIIKAMMGVDIIQCEHCGYDQFKEKVIAKNPLWKNTWLYIPVHNKDPAQLNKYRSKLTRLHQENGKSMPFLRQNFHKTRKPTLSPC